MRSYKSILPALGLSERSHASLDDAVGRMKEAWYLCLALSSDLFRGPLEWVDEAEGAMSVYAEIDGERTHLGRIWPVYPKKELEDEQS